MFFRPSRILQCIFPWYQTEALCNAVARRPLPLSKLNEGVERYRSSRKQVSGEFLPRFLSPLPLGRKGLRGFPYVTFAKKPCPHFYTNSLIGLPYSVHISKTPTLECRRHKWRLPKEVSAAANRYRTLLPFRLHLTSLLSFVRERLGVISS